MKKVELGCTCGMHRSTWSAEKRAYYNYLRNQAIDIQETKTSQEISSEFYWGWVVVVAAIVMMWVFL